MTPRAARGNSRARISSATSSIMRSPIRATRGRFSPPRAPVISDRRSSARPIAGERGRRPRNRPRSNPAAAAPSIIRSGSPRGTRRSRVSGTRAPRRRDCSVPPTAARHGPASMGSTSIRERKAWCGGDQDGTPDGPKLHSVLVDPRDPGHLYIGMSSGGVFESTDGGGGLAPAEQRGESVVPARPRPAVRARSALRAPASPRTRPPLSAEPLRHLSARPACRSLDGYRRGDAEIRGADRLPDGPASARPRYAVGIPDGWLGRLAAHLARREAGGVPIGQRRQDLATPGDRPAQDAGLVDGQATGNDGGSRADSGRLLRHDERRGLGQS